MSGPEPCEFDFDRIYQDHHRDVYRFALYLTHDRQETDDLFQDTWLRVVKNRDRVRRSGNTKAWILTITMNLYRDKLRKKKVRNLFAFRKGGEIQALEQNKTYSDNPARRLELSTAGEAVMKAVETLSQRQKHVFLLKEVEGLQHSEIAGIMQIPLGTVKSLLHRAVKNLQKCLTDYAPPQHLNQRRES